MSQGELLPGVGTSAVDLSATLRWRIVWTRAISMAWEKEDYEKSLIADPRTFFKQWFDYELNPDLDLEIQKAPESAAYIPDPPNGTPVSKFDPWMNMPKNKVTMMLPPAPKNVELRAVAITFYADTGRSHPFTSC